MINDIQQQLHLFFPGQNFPDEEVKESLERGDIITGVEKILPFLQTALIDDKVLEIELDSKPRIYFSRLKDDPPDETEDELTDDVIVDVPEYNKGDYLKTMSHIVALPLEPGLGNLNLRYSRFIVIRMFTNTYAVELCTTFEALTKVEDIPVLRLSFPTLARIVRNAREFRAKVPDIMDFTVTIEMDDNRPTLTTTPLDISLKGISVSVSQDEQKLFLQGSSHSIKLYLNEELVVELNGTVKHLSKVRKKGGIEYVCGVEFDLVTPTLAAVVESTVASVQRAHLKDLNEKSDASGIKLIA
jgi:c-di-GMP-binding flagellar brake protein YcgR